MLKQPVAFDGDRTKWAEWAFTVRAYARAVSTRMVVLMEHAQSATDLLDLPTAPSDNQVNAQLYYVLAVLVKDGAMKKARNTRMSHGSEIWSLLCEEYEPRQRRRFQAMLSAILRVQLKEPPGVSLDGFQRQVHAYEDQSGTPIPDEILAATDNEKEMELGGQVTEKVDVCGSEVEERMEQLEACARDAAKELKM